MLPPVFFVNAINSFDPLLNVRWGDFTKCWIIDRKSVIGETEIFYLRRRFDRLQRFIRNAGGKNSKTIIKLKKAFEGVAEELMSAELGRRVIIYTHRLDDKIFNALAMSDIKNYGGYSRFADEQDAKENKLLEKAERDMTDKQVNFNKEVFDMLNFVWRKNEDRLINGERNLGMLVHGKKSEGPLIHLSEF